MKQWNRRERFLIFVLSVLVVFAAYWFGTSWWSNRPNQPAAYQAAISTINYNFSTIQPQGSAVKLVPNSESYPHSLNMPSQNLQVGSTFFIDFRHVSGEYTIKQIEADGVIISYRVGAYHPFGDVGGRGQVKIYWKKGKPK